MNSKLLPALLLFAVACGGPDTDFSESSAIPVNPLPVELCNEVWDNLPLHTAHPQSTNPYPLAGVTMKDGPVLLGIWQAFARTTNRGNAVKIGPNGFGASPNFPGTEVPGAAKGVATLYKTTRPGRGRLSLPVQGGTKLRVEILDATGDILVLHDDYVTACSTLPTRAGIRARVLMTDAQGLEVKINIPITL